MQRVVVIGAGVSGLATAWWIRREARERRISLALSLFEASSTAGGHVRSEVVDGFVCERGPSGFLDEAPRTLELVDQLGLGHRMITADPAAARRYVYHSGRLHEVPTRPLAFLRSSVLPWSAKARILAEPFVVRRREDCEESVADFARRRLGRGFARYLLDPMVSGIFAGDPEALSLAAAFPKMAALEHEHGGLFRALAKRRAAAGGPAGPAGTLRSFPRGMGELTDALVTELQAELQTNAPVRRLERDGEAWRVILDGRSVEADRLVLACPAHAAAPLVAPLDLGAAAALDAIPFASVGVVCEGHGSADLARPLDGFGVLAPRDEGLRILGVLACDRIFPDHAPAGHRLLRSLVGGARDPAAATLSDDDLGAIVHRDLDRLVGLRGDPRPSRIYRHDRAIPQYTIGHLDRVATIDRFARESGLSFTGASHRGVSVNGCIEDAFRTAEAIVDALARNGSKRRARAKSRTPAPQATKTVSR
jgi:protoporphyrinogen/coproporphyrinogen III oxidase